MASVRSRTRTGGEPDKRGNRAEKTPPLNRATSARAPQQPDTVEPLHGDSYASNSYGREPYVREPSARAPYPAEPYRAERPLSESEMGPTAPAFQAAVAGGLGNSAMVSAQLWLQESPWRLTAGWSVLAALLAYGWLSRSFFIDWRIVALALLLADPLWGSIWRLAGGRAALLPLRRQPQSEPLWLPYLRPGSPAAQLFGWDHAQSDDPTHSAPRNALPLVFRVALPTLVLPLAVGWVLGAQALWLTVGVVVISALGWMGRQFSATAPAILQSLVTVTLPWTLMLGLLNMSRSHELFGLHVALIGLWTVHHWGQARVTRAALRNGPPDGSRDPSGGGLHSGPGADRLGIGLIAFADLGLGALLIFAQTPLWLAPLAILWLPTYVTLYQGKRIQRPAFWWLAAMLLSSAAIGSRML